MRTSATRTWPRRSTTLLDFAKGETRGTESCYKPCTDSQCKRPNRTKSEIVCQSDLVMYLHTNRSLIYPEFMGASLADLGLGRSADSRRVEGATASDQKTVSSYGIVSVTPSTTCIDAFRVMRNNLGLRRGHREEKKESFWGAFSETDISYFADPDFAMALGLSVSQFLFLRHNASPKITHGVFAGADAFDAALQNALYDSWRVYCKLEDKLEERLGTHEHGRGA